MSGIWNLFLNNNNTNRFIFKQKRSTGCIVFELVTLEQPFKGNSLIELAEAIFANKIPEFNAPKHIKLLVKM